jgi:hypothetical protein
MQLRRLVKRADDKEIWEGKKPEGKFVFPSGQYSTSAIERLHPRLTPDPCPGSSGVEQWIENPRVGGSIPPLGTIFTNNNNDLAERNAR